MLALASAPVSFAPAMAPARAGSVKMSFSDEVSFDAKPWSSAEVGDKAGLEALAKKLNPGAPPLLSRAASGNKNN